MREIGSGDGSASEKETEIGVRKDGKGSTCERTVHGGRESLLGTGLVLVTGESPKTHQFWCGIASPRCHHLVRQPLI